MGEANPSGLRVILPSKPKELICKIEGCGGILKPISDSKGGEMWMACNKCGTVVTADEYFQPKEKFVRVDERAEYLKWWLSSKEDKRRL